MTNDRPTPLVRAVPQTYKGVNFASTLEADWASTFDYHRITWSYEPVAQRLSDGQLYRCDFWLPHQRVWCEVKGPHEQRIDKPRKLGADLFGDPDDWKAPLVIVCRTPERADGIVERHDGEPIGFGQCVRCEHYTFVDLHGAWQCRICGHWDKALSQDFRLSFGRFGDAVAVEQATKQLYRLIDVLKVQDVTEDQLVEHELAPLH